MEHTLCVQCVYCVCIVCVVYCVLCVYSVCVVAWGSTPLVQLKRKSSCFVSLSPFSLSTPRSSYFPPSRFLPYLRLPRSLLCINSSLFVAVRRLTLFQSVSNVFHLFILHNPHFCVYFYSSHTHTHTRDRNTHTSVCVFKYHRIF